MNRDEVLDWIDSAEKQKLMDPPAGVRDTLDSDRVCRGYYDLSVRLTQAQPEADLWEKFRLRRIVSQSSGRERRRTRRLLYAFGAAAAAAVLAVLFFTIPPKGGDEQYRQEAVYYEPLELFVGIANDFNIDGPVIEGSSYGALDYYYAVSLF